MANWVILESKSRPEDNLSSDIEYLLHQVHVTVSQPAPPPETPFLGLPPVSPPLQPALTARHAITSPKTVQGGGGLLFLAKVVHTKRIYSRINEVVVT